MLKTFTTGILLGIAGVIAALYFFPAVNQHREVSIIAVTPNGINAESFHVNIPMDRIMMGDQVSGRVLPPDLRWPDSQVVEGATVELFKLRNSRNAVVGVASRLAASKAEIGDVIEWVLHLPARGSMFVKLGLEPAETGRFGEIRAGTREFEDMIGGMSERWIADGESEEDDQAGRIQLVTTFKSRDSTDDKDSIE